MGYGLETRIAVLCGLTVCALSSSASADFATEVMADSPEAYYRFEEPAGNTTIRDSSGNGLDSTAVVNVELGSSGPLGLAGRFSGDGYAQLGLQLSPAGGDFSIEALVRFDVTDVNRSIVSQHPGRALLYRLGSGKLRTYLGGSRNSSSFAASEGDWHHVVMTVEVDPGGTDDTIRFYIDGQATGTGTETAEPASGSWRLGNNLIGAIDELAVYTRLLNVSRIQAHYEATVPDTHYVAVGGPSIHPYTNRSMAASSIQDAVDAAGSGDTVLVNDGVYATGSRAVYNMDNRVVLPRPVRLRSVNGAAVTTIQGRSDPVTTNGPAAVRCVYVTNGAWLVGFTISDGHTRELSGGGDDEERRQGGGGAWLDRGGLVSNCVFTGSSAARCGGGVHCSYGGLVTDCTFSGNEAGIGGGAACFGGGVLEDSELTGNVAVYEGGGAYAEEGGLVRACTIHDNDSLDVGGGVATRPGGVFEDCSIEVNSAPVGGGAHMYGGGTLRDCTIRNNDASDRYRNGGGGVFCFTGGTVEDSHITSNDSESSGGGVCFFATGGLVQRCRIDHNDAQSSGGGVDGPGTVKNCLFQWNSADLGGAISGQGGRFWNCTIHRNHALKGGGFYSYSGGEVRNCILWGNTARDADANWHCPSTPASFSHCCLSPIPLGNGHIDLDPRFFDGVNGGFRLHHESPCIEAGMSLTQVTDDYAGDPRPTDGDLDGTNLYDIGAYEYDPYRRDTDGDGRTDAAEVLSGLRMDYDESYAIQYVLDHPLQYALYSSNSVADLLLGRMRSEHENGTIRLQLQIQQRDGTPGGTWENSGSTLKWTVSPDDRRAFLRARSGN